MGDRTLELTVTDGYDDAEESRAGRVFVMGKIFASLANRDDDEELEHFVFHAHDDNGTDYIVVVGNRSSEEVWRKLWEDGYTNIVIDRGMAMVAIPTLPPESDEKPIAPEIP